VQAAYAAINRGDYQIAYSLGLARHGRSYADFVAGYSNTSHVTVTILFVQGDTVAVRLVAGQRDHTSITFAGTYTVTRGVITGSLIRQTS